MENPFDLIEARLSNIERLLLDIKNNSVDSAKGKKLHSNKELADFLKVSTTTAQRYKNEGCPCIQNGRKIIFDTEEVLKWVYENGIQKKNF